MSVAEILEAIRRLPAAERRGLVEHIWQAWPVHEGVFPWNPPKAEIDTLLERANELERTEHLLKNSREPEPAPPPEPAAEPEAPPKKPADPKPFEKVLAEISERPVSPQELADEAAILGRRLREHLDNPAGAGQGAA
jgi:hypothetical protein